jgi:integrase
MNSRGAMFRLTVADLSKLPEGFYADGGNLYLSVERNKARNGFNRRWIFRYQQPGGRQRDMGLGSVDQLGANTSGLSVARELAQNARQSLARGIDPIDARKAKLAENAAAIPVPTFEALAAEYLAARDGSWMPKVAAHWAMTFREYCKPLHKLPVNLIDTDHVLKCLHPIWKEKTETARRVQNRIERVLSFAAVRKFRTDENPARWVDHLDHLLADPGKIAKTKNHDALEYSELPAFMAELLARKPIAGTLALEFLILTAARTDEVLKAQWSEIDLDEKTWTVPADRMKMRKEHCVPLTPRALEVLKAARKINPNGKHLFVGYSGSHLQGHALLALIQRRMNRSDITTQGFRATFKTWAGEETNFPRDVVEMCLAHQVGNAVENAYKRGTMIEKRRKVLEAWAGYCSKPPVADSRVLTFKRT